MIEYLAPGVYVKETSVVHGPISPSSTSTTAFVGATLKGSLHTATEVSNFAEYRDAFGPASLASPVSLAVLHYFSNGGRKAVVVRAAPASTRGRTRVGFADIIGEAGKGTGIHALGKSPSPGLLVTPDAGAMTSREHGSLVKAVLTYCDEHRIFYILDVPRSRSRQDSVDSVINWAKRSGALRHPNAAVYFPRIRTSDPSGKSGSLLAPASGAIAGVFARTDIQRGVWQAPAGTGAKLVGIEGVETDLSENQMEGLRRVSVNSLRPFPGRGTLVWGARTFESTGTGSEWKYVPVRRTLLFIERSLDEGLSWTVFEPNGEALWAQIRLSVSSFLNYLFRRGAFAGASARDAYFVKCEPGTTTPSDVRDGRVVVMVGFAPLKPAEFVVLRLAFRVAESS